MNTNANSGSTQLPVAGWADTTWLCTVTPAIEGGVIGADGLIAEVWFPSTEDLAIGSWQEQVMRDIRREYLEKRGWQKVYSGSSMVRCFDGREQWYYSVKAMDGV